MAKMGARTTPELLAELARTYGDQEALVDGETRYSFASLWSEVRRFARGLIALGVRPGDHVAILMGNRAEWVVADMAIATIGAIMASVSTYVTARELHYILDHSDADYLVYESRFLKYDYADLLRQLEPLAETLPRLRRTICLGENRHEDSLSYEAVFGLGETISEVELDRYASAVGPGDIAALLYTSGSTSTPKGVQIAHGDAIENMWHIGNRMHARPGDRFWCAISMFWGLGCMNILYNAYTHASCIVIQRSFDAGEALRLIEAERCTMIYAFPNTVSALVDHPDRAGRDLSSLRSGGTVGTPEQIRKAMNLGATEVCQIYGLTETYGNCAVCDGRHDPLDKRLASCGRALPGAVIRVVDPETLVERQPGEVGEIQVLSRVMPGYYKDEDKNAESYLPDGYFRTGDLGALDEDGYLYFKGRLKDVIKAGGINVSPAEVEKEILSEDGIESAYVVAVPDPVKDEVVGAVIVIENGVDAGSIKSALRERLSHKLSNYKRPSVYRFVQESELPLTTTGKVKRNELFRLFEKDAEG